VNSQDEMAANLCALCLKDLPTGSGPMVFWCRGCYRGYEGDIRAKAPWTIALRQTEDNRRKKRKRRYDFGRSSEGSLDGVLPGAGSARSSSRRRYDEDGYEIQKRVSSAELEKGRLMAGLAEEIQNYRQLLSTLSHI
jgi:hypothetical protein